MKKYLSYIVAFTIILIGLSSCHTSAPRLDYKALATGIRPFGSGY